MYISLPILKQMAEEELDKKKILDKKTFYDHIKKERYKNVGLSINERIPTKDKKFDLYLHIPPLYDNKNKANNYSQHWNIEYRIYKHFSNEFVQDTKMANIIKEELYTDYKLYKFLNRQLAIFYIKNDLI